MLLWRAATADLRTVRTLAEVYAENGYRTAAFIRNAQLKPGQKSVAVGVVVPREEPHLADQVLDALGVFLGRGGAVRTERHYLSQNAAGNRPRRPRIPYRRDRG